MTRLSMRGRRLLSATAVFALVFVSSACASSTGAASGGSAGSAGSASGDSAGASGQGSVGDPGPGGSNGSGGSSEASAGGLGIVGGSGSAGSGGKSAAGGAVGVGGTGGAGGAQGSGGSASAGGAQGAGGGNGNPILSIAGDRFLLDGKPFDMWGMRTASAAQSDAMTQDLIGNFDDYVRHHLNTVTVFYQGSSGGNSRAFSSDGATMDAAVNARMKRIIEAAGARNMVVVVGLFYQNASTLTSSSAYLSATRRAVGDLVKYRNIIINIANEQNSGGWGGTPYDMTKPGNITALCKLVHETDPARLCGGGGYSHPNNEVIGASPDTDVLLFDTLGPEDSGALYQRFVAAGVKKPIVNVETFGNAIPSLDIYLREADAGLAHGGLSIFYFNLDLLQRPVDMNTYGLDRSGIRDYWAYVLKKIGPS